MKNTESAGALARRGDKADSGVAAHMSPADMSQARAKHRDPRDAAGPRR